MTGLNLEQEEKEDEKIDKKNLDKMLKLFKQNRFSSWNLEPEK